MIHLHADVEGEVFDIVVRELQELCFHLKLPGPLVPLGVPNALFQFVQLPRGVAHHDFARFAKADGGGPLDVGLNPVIFQDLLAEELRIVGGFREIRNQAGG